MFEQLIEAVKCNSLGQISHALNEVGGVSEEYVGMEKNATSVIRWAGSKRKILPVLRDAYRKSGAKGRYVEPFAGSAALFFDLSPESAVLSDANEELVNALIKLQVDPDGLYAEVTSVSLDEDTYYRVRNFEGGLTNEARFFYLNRLCFNGIYRTNRSGGFNVPYGGAKAGRIPPIERWQRCSALLQKADLRTGDFAKVILEVVKKDDFVYLDPPYAVSNRRIFRQYTAAEFGLDDVARLNSLLKEIDGRGAKFLVSYAQSPETKSISSGWNISKTIAQRNVAGFAKHRRKAVEVLISNF